MQTLSDIRVDVLDLRSYHDGALPGGCVENSLAQTQGFWCRFYVFVDVDVLDGALESHAERRFQLDAFAFALRTHVCKVFCLARIHWQIFWPRVLAYHHSFVNIFLRPDEKPAARLDIVERVSSTDSIFHRHHYSATASANLAFEGRVFAKEMTHHPFAAGQVDEIGLEADQAPRGDDCFNRNARSVMIRAENLAFAIGNRL